MVTVVTTAVVCAGAIASDEVAVFGGSFEMGNPWGDYYDNETPVHTVQLSPYYIDVLETTTEEFCVFLNEALAASEIRIENGNQIYSADGSTLYGYFRATGFYTHLEFDGQQFAPEQGGINPDLDYEQHPIVGVMWYGAAAYCNWRSREAGLNECFDEQTWVCDFGANGYRLPTEAEWERAAAWEDGEGHWRFACCCQVLVGTRFNSNGSGDPYEGDLNLATTPAGWYDGMNPNTDNCLSPVGLRDMSGNVWEWVYDRLQDNYYDQEPPGGWVDPAGPGTGSYRVIRGGSWAGCGWCDTRCSRRGSAIPAWGDAKIGFRCARKGIGIPTPTPTHTPTATLTDTPEGWPTATPTDTPTVTPTRQRGDVDADGDIDLFDILRIVDIALELPPPPSEYEVWAADVATDGEIDLFDVLMTVDLILM